MKTQYIIQESNKIKREEVYNYIKDNYKLKNKYPYKKEKFIESNFPFIVDFNEKIFWICDSITCCACAASNHQILTLEEFEIKVENK